jgi:DNA-binding NtrC family response regulator
MILGPTGVGKRLLLYLAKRFFMKAHQNEERVPPIIEANCGHFAGKDRDVNITRSELFGHVKGAYSGATKNKEGLVKDADRGMLILEEIGELPSEAQALLLTFIETGEYRRVGENKTRKATVKIVGATNREPDLRDDFKYRFIPIYLPPVRERKSDVLYYFELIFPELTAQLTRAEVLLLLSHHWPGNVREIERVGRLLMREKLIEGGVGERHPTSQRSTDQPRIHHLDPREISFDPAASEKLYHEIKSFGVDVSLLENLLKKNRVSIDSEKTDPAFKELTGRGALKRKMKRSRARSATITLPHKPNKRQADPEAIYYSVFDEFPLKFCKEFEPFEEAHEGYLCFCGLFLQDPSKDKNILASLEKCNFSHFTIDRLKFAESDHGRVKKLAMDIMKYLKGADPNPEYRWPDNFADLWIALCKMTDEGDSAIDLELEESLEAIATLKQKDLLKSYYRKLLDKTGGNVKAASRRAGIKESTFRSQMVKLRVRFKKDERSIL